MKLLVVWFFGLSVIAFALVYCTVGFIVHYNRWLDRKHQETIESDEFWKEIEALEEMFRGSPS